jgi:hypothetical protein
MLFDNGSQGFEICYVHLPPRLVSIVDQDRAAAAMLNGMISTEDVEDFMPSEFSSSRHGSLETDHPLHIDRQGKERCHRMYSAVSQPSAFCVVETVFFTSDSVASFKLSLIPTEVQ